MFNRYFERVKHVRASFKFGKGILYKHRIRINHMLTLENLYFVIIKKPLVLARYF